MKVNTILVWIKIYFFRKILRKRISTICEEIYEIVDKNFFKKKNIHKYVYKKYIMWIKKKFLHLNMCKLIINFYNCGLKVKNISTSVCKVLR